MLQQNVFQQPASR